MIGETKKKKKGFKVITIIFSLLMIITCVGVATLGVLDIAEILPLYDVQLHYYNYTFHDYKGEVIKTYKVLKGKSFEKEAPTTSRENELVEVGQKEIDGQIIPIYKEMTYTFLGWDINGDNRVDSFPSKTYFSVDANPVFKLESRVLE